MSLARHFMTLFSGRLVAQIILIISTPILTRLFAPEDFGLIALVSSITQVPMILLMGRLDHAIPQSRDDAEAGRLVALSLCWASVMTVICLFGALASGAWLARRYQQPQLQLILLASISLFMPAALAQLGKQWAAYRERHGVTASADVILTAVRRLSPMSMYHVWGAGPWPLFIGQAAGVLASALTFTSRLGRDVISCLTFNPRMLWETLVTYRNFPLFLGSSSLFDILAWSALSILIGDFFGLEAVGWFGQTHALLFLPISLLNQSSTNIFYPRLAQARGDAQEMGRLLTSMVNLSFDLGLYPLLILLPLAPSLWGLLLGESFYTSGEIAQVLIPMGVANVIFSPVSVAINVFHKQRAYFWQSISLNMARTGALYMGCLTSDLLIALGAYAALTTISRVGQLYWLLALGDVSLFGVVKGALPKTLYTLGIGFIVWGIAPANPTAGEIWPSLGLALTIATLGGLGWLWLITRYNQDAQALLERLTSRVTR